jgi:hypothetical protein
MQFKKNGSSHIEKRSVVSVVCLEKAFVQEQNVPESIGV